MNKEGAHIEMETYCHACGNAPGLGDSCVLCGASNPDRDRTGCECPTCGDPMQVSVVTPRVEVEHCPICDR